MVSYADTASLRHDVDTLDRSGREVKGWVKVGGLACQVELLKGWEDCLYSRL
ncbi:hypothetical protein BDV24DRAFT_121544 [Aspergillus arachidicola]|uniref:Uncharacterized protein n=1 Tax=Aspergillus arachidicola TaxID=656916 RepID=A0A5N6YR65_9EURO|nr:hypothetical protein BDV24DRAFT_121544 [Aspergillus arachidicola]